MSLRMPNVRSPLTFRLLRRILFLGLLLAALFAGVRGWQEYSRALEMARTHMSGIEASMGPPLAHSLWDYDQDQLQSLLDGIRSSPDINYAAVLDHGRVLAEDGLRKPSDVLQHETELTRQHLGKVVPLGSLLLQVDLARVRSQAYRSAGLAVMVSFGTVLMVCLAVFLLTRGMVSRHLSAVAEHFLTLRLDTAEEALPPLRLDKRRAGDELDVLCDAVNAMQEGLVRSYRQAWEAEREALSQARFPRENPNPVLRVLESGEISIANEASLPLLRGLGSGPGLPLPEPQLTVVRQALASGQTCQFELEHQGRVFAFAARPLPKQGYVNLYGMDITERNQATQAIRRSLEEKEVLLKEIHHRVKNNLQIISSLLFLQMEYVHDERDRELFAESQKRIQVMALVHEELYGAKDLASVDMADYVPRLVERVLSGALMSVRVDFDVEPLPLPVTRSIPCGLILNELVMNAVKHAFRPEAPGAGGKLRVSLRRNGTDIVLEVADDGPGLPPDFDIAAAPSLGMTLVASLSQQLGGSVEAQNLNPGALFRLRFSCGAA